MKSIKKINTFLLLLALSIPGIGILSCCKDDEHHGDGEFVSMSFGKFFGECGGPGCVTIFKLEDGKIYEDTSDVYPNAVTPYDGKYIQHSNANYESIKELIYDIPSELYADEDHILGIPDGGDWGGMYFEVNFKNDDTKSGVWLLDLNQNYQTQAVNDFVARINEKIGLIE